ncbi:MAG TPA: hypothetical protein PKA38_00570 [Candidatus Levybacteria bacterium]|nr:hypothetical protein [Candidatus Levybacteria bacterium]
MMTISFFLKIILLLVLLSLLAVNYLHQRETLRIAKRLDIALPVLVKEAASIQVFISMLLLGIFTVLFLVFA